MELNDKQKDILDYLKTNCKGEKNAVRGRDLAEIFNVKPNTFRVLIKKIKMNQDILIGTNGRGYFIPYKDEVQASLRYRKNKVLSELKGCVKDDPKFVLEVFKLLNIKVDDATQGQLTFNYNTNETESVDYLNEKQ